MVILSLLATHESEKLACAVLRLSAFATECGHYKCQLHAGNEKYHCHLRILAELSVPVVIRATFLVAGS